MSLAPDEAARIEALCVRWELGVRAPEQLAALLEALTGPLAPTAVDDRGTALDVHVADSLTGLALPALREADRIADVGSGAGLPGLVLAIALPEAEVDLIESVRRKCDHIRRTAAAVDLSNARTICARAEQRAAGEGAGAYEAVTARAVDELPTVLEYAAPLLCVGGSLVAWRGARDRDEEERAAVAARILGMELAAVEAARPYERSRNRHLHWYRKLAPTPDRFPRRAGVARKRPLA